jgi:hypothetical protein
MTDVYRATDRDLSFIIYLDISDLFTTKSHNESNKKADKSGRSMADGWQMADGRWEMTSFRDGGGKCPAEWSQVQRHEPWSFPADCVAIFGDHLIPTEGKSMHN